MSKHIDQLAIPVALPSARRPPGRTSSGTSARHPYGELPHVQLRSELQASSWQIEPRTVWYAAASIRLTRFGTVLDAQRHEAHATLAHNLAAWLANQPQTVGLQLVLAAHPGRYRAHVAVRVEVSDPEVDRARGRVHEAVRQIGLLLGGASAFETEPEHPASAGLAWLAGSATGGLAAKPLAPRLRLSLDRDVALLPEPRPDLWARGGDLLRIMLEQQAPTAALVSLQRVDRADLLVLLQAQLSHLHASLRTGREGALFSGSSSTTTRHYPEDLMFLTSAGARLEQHAAWIAELHRGSLAMQVALLGDVRSGDALTQAAQQALVGSDAAWLPLSHEQAELVKAGPMGAIACPLTSGYRSSHDDAEHDMEDLVRLVTVECAAKALQLPSPSHDGLPGIPVERAPLRFAPSTMAHADGVLLGACRTRRSPTPVRLQLEDLDRHLYVVGKTGTGKTTLLTTLMLDMRAKGLPFAVIDPHGDLSGELLQRMGGDPDVVVFDPARGVGPGLNPLANDGTVQGVERVLENITASMFQLYPPEFMGPVFERHSRALLLPLATIGEGLASVSRMAHDAAFRKRCLRKLDQQDPVHAEVIRFYEEEVEPMLRSSKSELHTYTVSKYDALVRSSTLRAAVDPTRPQLDLGAIMDQGKVLIARLPQGELGAISAWFLGMMLVDRLKHAVFARSSQRVQQRQPYTLVLDEFQHFLGGAGYGYRNDDRSLGPFLSETRKYGLRVALAHQHLAQCDTRTREAVLGNVGSMVVFRVGHNDAELLARELDDSIDPAELRKQPLFRAVASLLVAGSPARPFTLETIPPDRLALPVQRQRRRPRG